jgi:hypothetical protein
MTSLSHAHRPTWTGPREQTSLVAPATGGARVPRSLGSTGFQSLPSSPVTSASSALAATLHSWAVAHFAATRSLGNEQLHVEGPSTM